MSRDNVPALIECIVSTPAWMDPSGRAHASHTYLVACVGVPPLGSILSARNAAGTHAMRLRVFAVELPGVVARREDEAAAAGVDFRPRVQAMLEGCEAVSRGPARLNVTTDPRAAVRVEMPGLWLREEGEA